MISTIITVLLIAGGYLWYSNRDELSSDITYYTYFANADGISPGAVVELKGVRIGKVQNIELNSQHGIKLTLNIDSDVQIPKGTKANIASAGMSGERELRLIPGQGPGYIIENGVISSEQNVATLTNAGKVGATVKLAKGALKTANTMVTSINDLVGGVRGRQEIRLQIDEINKQTLQASKQSFSIKGNGEKFARSINSMDSSLTKAAVNSKEWTGDMQNAERQTYDMAKSTANIHEDFRNLQNNFKNLRSTFAKVNSDTGTLGKWLNEPQPYQTTTRSWDTTHRTLKDVMDRPSAYWFAIFGKNR